MFNTFETIKDKQEMIDSSISVESGEKKDTIYNQRSNVLNLFIVSRWKTKCFIECTVFIETQFQHKIVHVYE